MPVPFFLAALLGKAATGAVSKGLAVRGRPTTDIARLPRKSAARSSERSAIRRSSRTLSTRDQARPTRED